MVSVSVNGQFLELEGVEIGFDILHPAFDDTVLGGGYSVPLDIKSTGRNASILGFSNLMSADLPAYKYDCIIYWKGNIWSRGKLVVDRPGSEVSSAYITVGIRAFDVLDKKMNEVNYGPDYFLGANQDAILAAAKTIVQSGTWSSPGFDFPTIYNSKFYEDKNTDYGGYMNYWLKSQQKFYKNVTGNAGDPINVNTMVPQPYVFFLLKKIMEEENLTLDEDILADTSLAFGKMHISDNYALDQMGTAHFKVHTKQGSQTTYATPNVAFTDTSVRVHLDTEVEDPDNINDHTLYEYVIQQDGDVKVEFAGAFKDAGDTTNVIFSIYFEYMVGPIPFKDRIYVRQFLRSASGSFNETISMAFLPADIGKKVTMHIMGVAPYGNTGHVTVTDASLKIIPLTGTSVNEMASSVNLKNHVPDWTVKEFLESLRDSFNISFIVDPVLSRVYIRKNITGLTAVKDDDTRKADPTHTGTPNDQSLKMIGYEWPSDDALMEGNFKEYDKGLDKGTIDSYSNLPTPSLSGQTVLITDLGQRWITYFDEATQQYYWKYFRDEYDDRWYSLLNSVEHKSRLTPIFMDYRKLETSGNPVVLPRIEVQGSSLAFTTGVNKVTPRYFWKCSSLFTGSNFYPASTTRPKIGSTSTGFIGSRYVEGELYDFWKDWIDKILNQPVLWEKELNLNINDLMRLMRPADGILYLRHIDTNDVLYKRLSISLGDEVGISKAEMLKKNH